MQTILETLYLYKNTRYIWYYLSYKVDMGSYFNYTIVALLYLLVEFLKINVKKVNER